MDRETFQLVQVISPIVEGQLRTLIRGHPNILAGVTWGPRGKDKSDVLVDSAAKRICTALLCPETVARMRSVFSEAGKTGRDGEGFLPPHGKLSAVSSDAAGELGRRLRSAA